MLVTGAHNPRRRQGTRYPSTRTDTGLPLPNITPDPVQRPKTLLANIAQKTEAELVRRKEKDREWEDVLDVRFSFDCAIIARAHTHSLVCISSNARFRSCKSFQDDTSSRFLRFQWLSFHACPSFCSHALWPRWSYNGRPPYAYIETHPFDSL